MNSQKQEGALGELFDNEVAPSIGVVSIGKKQYAVNLIWGAEESASAARSSIKHTAKQLGSNLACQYKVHLGSGVQYGLADKNFGHKRAMNTLAPSLAQASSSSVIGAWKTDEGYWVIIGIQKDTAILLDKALNNEHNALELFSEEVYLQDWDRIYCPSDWNIDGAVEGIALAELLVKKNFPIKEISKGFMSYLLPILIILVIAGIGFITNEIYKEYLVKQEKRRQYELMEREARRRAELDAIKKQEPAPPWINKHIGVQVLANCVSAAKYYLGVSYDIPGWRPQGKAVCDGDAIIFRLSQQYGTSLWLNSASTLMASEKPKILMTQPKEALLMWELDEAERYQEKTRDKAAETSLPSLLNMRRYIEVSFEESFTPIRLENGQVKDNGKWQQLLFEYETKEQPELFIPIFAALPYVEVTSIECTFTDAGIQNWQINGIVHSDN